MNETYIVRLNVKGKNRRQCRQSMSQTKRDEFKRIQIKVGQLITHRENTCTIQSYTQLNAHSLTHMCECRWEKHTQNHNKHSTFKYVVHVSYTDRQRKSGTETKQKEEKEEERNHSTRLTSKHPNKCGILPTQAICCLLLLLLLLRLLTYNCFFFFFISFFLSFFPIVYSSLIAIVHAHNHNPADIFQKVQVVHTTTRIHARVCVRITCAHTHLNTPYDSRARALLAQALWLYGANEQCIAHFLTNTRERHRSKCLYT